MKLPWQRKQVQVTTLETMAVGHDETLKLLARTILSLQVQVAATQADVRPLVGRVDVLEGRDNSTEGSPRGESFAQIHNQLDQLTRQVKEAVG